MNVALDLKPDEVTMAPHAATIFQQRGESASRDLPSSFCLPLGVPLNSIGRRGVLQTSHMRHNGLLTGIALVAAVVAVASAFPAAQQKPHFSFHSNAWLNLHNFVRSNARGGPAPTGLTEEARAQWAAGVDFYKPYAPRDLVRDPGMVAIKDALRGAEGKTSLDGIAIDTALKATLERLMPIYQQRWWPEHDRANREWIAAMQPLVDRHGPALSQALARVYDVSWPRDPIPVDLSVTAGPGGAYGTNEPAHITISPSTFRGYTALEMLFHESTHGIAPLFQAVSAAATKQKVTVPLQLWHAVLFYTAGELTTRELKARGIDYTAYADASFYTTMCGAGCRDKIAEHWTPHLDGKRSTADALSALVVAFK